MIVPHSGRHLWSCALALLTVGFVALSAQAQDSRSQAGVVQPSLKFRLADRLVVGSDTSEGAIRAWAALGLDRGRALALSALVQNDGEPRLLGPPDLLNWKRHSHEIKRIVAKSFDVIDAETNCGLPWFEMVRQSASELDIPMAIRHRQTRLVFALVPPGIARASVQERYAKTPSPVSFGVVSVRPFYLSTVEFTQAAMAACESRPEEIGRARHGTDTPAFGITDLEIDAIKRALSLSLPYEWQMIYVRTLIESRWDRHELIDYSDIPKSLSTTSATKRATNGEKLAPSLMPFRGLYGGVAEWCEGGFCYDAYNPGTAEFYVDPIFSCPQEESRNCRALFGGSYLTPRAFVEMGVRTAASSLPGHRAQHTGMRPAVVAQQ